MVLDSTIYALTLDIDWAPDWMISDIANQLISEGVRATWFATHTSQAIKEIEGKSDLF